MVTRVRVADQLGHSSPLLALRTYAHAIREGEADLSFADCEVREGSQRLFCEAAPQVKCCSRSPRTGRPYSSHKLREVWIAACEAAEVEYVPLYRATKHTTFTALREAGVSRDEVQALARHRDPRTTDIYDLDDDQRRRRALASLDRLEARGRQTGDRFPALPASLVTAGYLTSTSESKRRAVQGVRFGEPEVTD